MKFKFSILLIILSTNVFSQTDCDCAERLYNLVEYQYANRETADALVTMKKTIDFNGNKATSSNYVVLSYLYADQDSIDQSLAAISKAIEKGMPLSKLESEKMQDIKKSAGETKWKHLTEKVDSLSNIYKSNLDLEYRLTIEYLLGGDQLVRSFPKLNSELVEYVDSVNFETLKKNLNKKGFPDRLKHGFDGTILEGFMLHYSVNSRDHLNEVLDILEPAADQQLIHRGFIATIKDRYEMRAGNKAQTYGLWNNWQDEDIFSTINSMETVDQERFKYNLLRLQEQAKVEGRKLPKGYQVTEYPTDYFCGFLVDFR